jgi:hypothetical protein
MPFAPFLFLELCHAMSDTRQTNLTARASLTARLWRAAEMQAAEIEARLSAGERPIAESERDARVLAILAKTLRELSSASLIPDEEEKEDDDATPDDVETLREALAQRLRRIAEDRHQQGHPA